MNELSAVDAMLETVAAVGDVPLEWSSHPEAFAALQGRGIEVHSKDVIDVDDEYGQEHVASGHPLELVRVIVDVGTVLRETLAPRGFEVVEDARASGSFFSLSSSQLPAECDAFFAARPGAPLYAARQLSSKSASLVVHVGDTPDTQLLSSMGVLPVRLRDLDHAFHSQLLDDLTQLSALRRAVAQDAEPLESSDIEEISRSHLGVDPSQVVTYASTTRDRDFESATARIMAPLTKVVPLGSKYTGRPFPDGLLVSQQSSNCAEVVHYDCKSKKKDEYGFDLPAGDQQNRYFAITRRLEQQGGWKARGVVMFTPHVERDDLAKQTQKEAWRLVKDDGRKLVVVPAASLLRWHEMTLFEGTDRMGSLFNTSLFWSALFDGELPGVSDPVGDKVWPDRSSWTRLITPAVAEICFLAGLAGTPTWITQIPKALGRADPNGRSPDESARPNIVNLLFEKLRSDRQTLESLRTALGLSEQAAMFLVNVDEFEPRGLNETGDNGSKHLRLLRNDCKP